MRTVLLTIALTFVFSSSCFAQNRGSIGQSIWGQRESRTSGGYTPVPSGNATSLNLNNNRWSSIRAEYKGNLDYHLRGGEHKVPYSFLRTLKQDEKVKLHNYLHARQKYGGWKNSYFDYRLIKRK